MTREKFVERFHWNKWMWIISIVNVIAFIPQPVMIIRTQVVDGIAIEMFALFALIQASFGIEFFIKKSRGPMISMIVSMCLSLTTIFLVLHFR